MSQGFRQEMSDSYSGNLFTKTASFVHPKNQMLGSGLGMMRGGIRL